MRGIYSGFQCLAKDAPGNKTIIELTMASLKGVLVDKAVECG